MVCCPIQAHAQEYAKRNLKKTIVDLHSHSSAPNNEFLDKGYRIFKNGKEIREIVDKKIQKTKIILPKVKPLLFNKSKLVVDNSKPLAPEFINLVKIALVDTQKYRIGHFLSTKTSGMFLIQNNMWIPVTSLRKTVASNSITNIFLGMILARK